MTVSLKHKFVSNVSDDDSVPNSVRPSNWNDEHDLTGTPFAFLGFDTNGDMAEVPTISFDADGRILFGGAAQTGVGWTPSYQWHSSGDGFGFFAWSASAGNAHLLQFHRSRNANIGTHTAVQANDALGYIDWGGSDGTNFINSAEIVSVVDGTVTTNSVPGRISFRTAKAGEQWAVERMRLDSSGRLVFGNTAAYNTSFASLIELHETRQYWFAGATFSNWSSRTGAWTDYPALQFTRSWGSAVGTHVCGPAGVNSVVMEISALGSDGVDFQNVVDIVAQVDGGAIGSPAFLPGRFSISTADNVTGALKQRLFCNSGGTIVLGVGSPQAFYGTDVGTLQIHGTDATTPVSGIFRWSANVGPPKFFFNKSRGATIGAQGAVAAGDVLGQLLFFGSDGAAFQQAGQLQFEADGTISSGIVPGRMAIYVANAAGTCTEQLRINNQGKITDGGDPINTLWDFTPHVEFNWGSVALHYFSASASPNLIFARSRNATKGSHTAVQSGDCLMNLEVGGSDGTHFAGAAAIRAYVDGTVSSNVVPTRFNIATVNSAGAEKDRITIKSEGDVKIGVGNGALATDSTFGFLHLPSCAGLPTGAPASLTTGIVPVIIDSTNYRIYGYIGSAWRQLT